MMRLAFRAVALLAAVLALLPQLHAGADAAQPSGLSIVPSSEVFARLEYARTATIAVYAIAPRSRLAASLETAADRGARVSVVLGRGSFGAAAEDSRTAAATLAQHRVEVHESAATSHIKVAVLDGVLYLSDRNFASSADETIILDTVPGDRELIDRLLVGSLGVSNDHLWTRKADALAAEARVLAARRSQSVDVSTESFGAGTSVFDALLARRQAGDRVRLLVGASEYATAPTTRHAVDSLRAAGVEVRPSPANEKFVADGDDVWVGSANATRGRPSQVDFGIAVRDADLANALRARFEREWAASGLTTARGL